MAIIKCKECGAEVSTSAFHCPKCGAAPAAMQGKQSTYAVITALLVLLVFVLMILGACSAPTAAAAPRTLLGSWAGKASDGSYVDTMTFATEREDTTEIGDRRQIFDGDFREIGGSSGSVEATVVNGSIDILTPNEIIAHFTDANTVHGTLFVSGVGHSYTLARITP